MYDILQLHLLRAGRGTQWTLLGSSTLQGASCDLTVHPESALYMDSGFKIVYVSPCYGHGDMLNDDASSYDATDYYCHNCTKEDALTCRNWSSTSTYSHALRILFSVF